MTLDIHVTVELQPSPQLVELFRNIEIHATASPGLLQLLEPRQPEHKQPTMPSMGETERLLHPGTKQQERKELKRPDLKPQEAGEEPKDPEPVLECFKSFFLPKEHPEFISLSEYNKHLSYFRVGNKICIQYRAARIFTTIDLIKQLGDTVPEYMQIGDFRKRPISNQKTAINQFWFAVARGLDLDTLVDKIDPDAEFRPVLNQSSQLQGDFGGGVEE